MNKEKPLKTAEEILKWCNDRYADVQPTANRLKKRNTPMAPQESLNFMAALVFYNIIGFITGREEKNE